MKPRFVLPLLSVVALGQSAGTFTATGSMITPRFFHTATLLPDGRVLIAGGAISCVVGSCINATTAELYDPASGTFSTAGAMNTIQPVGGILLPNGKVFFADGYPTGAGASIEFYDPSNGEFKIAGASASLSVVWSAALLNDGTVFMTGGNRSGSGAEIYDPVADAFSPIVTWPANIGYAFALAVLPDNRVVLDYPAIFDPASGALTTQSRWSGCDDYPPESLLVDGRVLWSGGNIDGEDVNWAELFDPSDGMFLVAGNMLFVRDGHTSTLLPDGEVLVAGGTTTFNHATLSYNVTGSAELYDPPAGAFSLTGSMTTPRQYHAAVLLNDGRVLITGGVETSPPEVPGRLFLGISSAELYTPDKLIAAPVLYSLSGDGHGQGAIWHASTGDIASAADPAGAGEALSMYTTSLAEGGVIPPQVSVGGRLAEILYFGDAPGYPGYFQVNFRVPGDVAPGPAVPVRLTYLARSSNEVTVAIH